MTGKRSTFSAAEPGLGYIYQLRFALLQILSLPEGNSLLFEKSDDVEFRDDGGAKTLGSLKHKARGDVLTDLSVDFWKSVRVWLAHYLESDRVLCETTFVLFTTADVSNASFLKLFVDDSADGKTRAEAAREALEKSQSQVIGPVKDTLALLKEDELQDFYARVVIVDANPRVTEIRERIIAQYLRTVRKEARTHLFERLEGWWTDLVIRMLAGERTEPIFGHEVSDKLSALAEEYRSDNLPITFRTKLPDGTIDAETDSRLFVEQLRVLELSAARIRNAIIDYYRAFEQRSSWARENLLISGEIEEYESRLVEEWSRYREVVLEQVGDAATSEVCISAGRQLLNWAQQETTTLRIRERVTEPYVMRGTFHILANERPSPRVYWHPHFLKRLKEILGMAA